MHIRKFDYDYSRRSFLEKTLLGMGGAGLLSAVWKEACATGDLSRSYPEELLDIEAFTKGHVKIGDVIDQDNVDLVQDIVDPILYQEVKQDGRKFYILPSEHRVETMYPPFFLDATIRNQGMAKFDNDGNVWTVDGQPWIGGLPFPDPQTGDEAIANITLSWGRHDRSMFAIPALVVAPEGNVQYEYDWVWAEQQCTGLVHPSAGGPYLEGYEDKTRLQSIWFTHTRDVYGHAFLSIWKYDQREIPDLYGYLPNLKRVRRFPAGQRFEPYKAGMNLYLSDAWSAGDPMLTWGNWQVIHRGPFLGSTHSQWMPEQDNWQPPLVGGKGGISYFYAGKALIPEVIVFEGEPVGFPNAPVSKRRIFLDVRNMGAVQAITYDRNGEMWKGLEGAGGLLESESRTITASDGRPEWTWSWAISHDVQRNDVTRFYQGETCRGDWRSQLDPDEDFVNNYLTQSALRRLGI